MKSTQFKAGNAGRPKGAKNKINQELKEKLENVSDESLDRLLKMLPDLKAKELIQVLNSTLKHVVPTLGSITAEVSSESLNWFDIPDETKAEILKELYAS